MAFSPMMPTSFLPSSVSSSLRQHTLDLSGAFAILAYGVFTISLLLAGAVFGYHWYLTGVEEEKSKKLEEAKASLNTETTDGFIRLHSRLEGSKERLNAHIAFSNVFDVVELIEPTKVRLNSLQLSPGESGTTLLSASGIAADFNALAYFSQILGKDEKLKNAIFSGLSISKTGVTFALTATVEPSVVAFTIANAESDTPVAPISDISTELEP